MFTLADLAELVHAARVKPTNDRDDLGRTLADRLTEVAMSFLVNRLWQQRPPPSDIVKQLGAVTSAAENLIARLPRSDDQARREVRYRLTAQAALRASTPELTDLAAGSERLRAAISAVQDLAAWSRAAIDREDRRKGTKVGHRGDVAMQQLIGDLNGVWIDYWERPPGTTSEGPYIRFVQAFLQCVERHITDEDLRADPGLRAALRATPEAIRERVQATRISKLRERG